MNLASWLLLLQQLKLYEELLQFQELCCRLYCHFQHLEASTNNFDMPVVSFEPGIKNIIVLKQVLIYYLKMHSFLQNSYQVEEKSGNQKIQQSVSTKKSLTLGCQRIKNVSIRCTCKMYTKYLCTQVVLLSIVP